MLTRQSGVLLHLTSLPSAFGVGDMGPAAYRFGDFLAQAGQGVWQVLPLNPTGPEHNNSPYHSTSAFAGNPMLISPELLARDGLLDEGDLKEIPHFPEERADYDAAQAHKRPLLEKAFERFKSRGEFHGYERFCSENKAWLDDFALFSALKNHFGGSLWCEWPAELRDRNEDALRDAAHQMGEAVERNRFLQYAFFSQWRKLKDHLNSLGVKVFGDVPIYVDLDSADVWANQELFKLGDDKRPYVVSGVPPDYFSETGQLWGHPLYRWEVMRETGYAWWIKRLGHNLKMFDMVRVDHFRGLVAYWEVAADEKTAINGRWVDAPVYDFLDTLARRFASLPVVAEDLGIITPDVREVMARFGLPGMRVILFGFGGDFPESFYLPHNYVRNCVAYTGTHDNNTARGWFENEATDEERKRLFKYLGREVGPEDVSLELARLVMMSVSGLAVIPMQDLLGLGGEARMNRPFKEKGNWEWRLSEGRLTRELDEMLHNITRAYGRA